MENKIIILLLILLIGVFFLVNFYEYLIGDIGTFAKAAPFMMLILIYPILISSIFIILIKKGSWIVGVIFSGMGTFHVNHEYANYLRLVELLEHSTEKMQNNIESQLDLVSGLVIFGIVLIGCGGYLIVKKAKLKQE